MSDNGNDNDDIRLARGKNTLLFNNMNKKPNIATSTSTPKPKTTSPLFSKAPLTLAYGSQRMGDGDDSGGGGHQATPATRTLASQVPAPDSPTPGLFATGKSSATTPFDPNTTRKIQTTSAGGLATVQYFGDKAQKVKNAKKAPAPNLSNANSIINRVLGPRLGKR